GDCPVRGGPRKNRGWAVGGGARRRAGAAGAGGGGGPGRGPRRHRPQPFRAPGGAGEGGAVGPAGGGPPGLGRRAGPGGRACRVVFVGLIPLVAMAGMLALPALVRIGRPAGEHATEHRLVDAVRVAAGSALLLQGFASRGALPAVLLLLAGLVVGLPALRRLLPPGTLSARRGLPATILSRGLLTFAFFGADAFVTLAITEVRHRSPVVAGIAVTGATLGWTAGAWVQARLSETWEGARFVRTGLVIIL